MVLPLHSCPGGLHKDSCSLSPEIYTTNAAFYSRERAEGVGERGRERRERRRDTKHALDVLDRLST